MPRSLQVDPQYREDVKMSLIRSGYTTQRQLAEDIKLALSTVNKFFNCKPIYNLNFIEICNSLNLNWEKIIDAQSQNISVDNMEISSKLKPIAKDKARIRFKIEATIEDLDKPLLDELIKLIQERSSDASFALKRIEEGSLIFTFEGSQEGSKRLQELFQSGQLKELLGFEVSNVELKLPQDNLVQLGQWLQNQFIEAERALWVTVDEIFGTQHFAFRNDRIQRAKKIQLGEQIINLLLEMEDLEEEFSIRLGIYPNSQEQLSKNLNVVIFDDNEQILIEISLANYPNGIVQELFFEPGEEFCIKITLDSYVYQECFLV